MDCCITSLRCAVAFADQRTTTMDPINGYRNMEIQTHPWFEDMQAVDNSRCNMRATPATAVVVQNVLVA